MLKQISGATKFLGRMAAVAALMGTFALGGCNTTEGVETYRTKDGGIINRIPVDLAVMPDGHQVVYAVNTHESFSVSNQATQVAWCNRYGSNCKPLGGSVNGADGIGSAGGRLLGGAGSLIGAIGGLGGFGGGGGGGGSVAAVFNVKGGNATANAKGGNAFANNKGIGNSDVHVGVKTNVSNTAVSGAAAISGSK